ncbi:hypothetical protein HQQ81_11695 [Microbacteriaceae bacterium VKM Ac-2854]|nr:hypothetical protein [Microbacteriaceae bacterium VKM Ac-2854]
MNESEAVLSAESVKTDPARGSRSTRRLFFGAAGAALAAGAFAQEAEAATTYATLDANGKVPVAQLPVATATSPGIITPEMTAKRDRVFFTADFGCTTNAGQECSAKLQDAINATAAAGGTLVVQQGRMSLNQPIWIPGGRINIRGAGMMNMLSWEGATFDGPAIKIGWSPTATEAQRGPIPGNPPAIAYGQIENLQFSGPTSATTTVDGWRFGEAGVTTDTSSWTLERLQWMGFRTQEIFGDGAANINHRACMYKAPAKNAVVFDGKVNCGDGLTWAECIFRDARNAGSTLLRAEQSAMLLDASFTSCSFDYSNRVLIAVAGTFQFNSCHFETSTGYPWFALSSNRTEVSGKDNGAVGRQTVLLINGGQLLPHVDFDGTRPAMATIVAIDDAFTDGASTVKKSNRPATVVIHGANVTGHFETRIIDSSRITDTRAKPRVSAVGNATHSRWTGNDRINFTATSWGPELSLTHNSGFDVTATFYDKAGPTVEELMKGWCTPAIAVTRWGLTEDTSTKLFGKRSMKFSSPSVVMHETMLAQVARVEGGKQLDLSIIERLASDWAGTYGVFLTEFDSLGRITVASQAILTAKVFSSDPRNSWRFTGYSHLPDVATMYVRLNFYGHFQGTLWIDSIELTQPA